MKLASLRPAIFASLSCAGVAAAGCGGALAAPRPITVSDLQGAWVASLFGITGVCGSSGPSSLLVTVQLGANGSSMGRTTIRTHSTKCGDSKTIFKKGAQPAFVIQNLYSDGTGTATLKCWTNCIWTFHVQVNPEGDAMSLTDLNDPNNTPAGLALKKQ